MTVRSGPYLLAGGALPEKRVPSGGITQEKCGKPLPNPWLVTSHIESIGFTFTGLSGYASNDCVFTGSS